MQLKNFSKSAKVGIVFLELKKRDIEISSFRNKFHTIDFIFEEILNMHEGKIN